MLVHQLIDEAGAECDDVKACGNYDNRPDAAVGFQKERQRNRACASRHVSGYDDQVGKGITVPPDVIVDTENEGAGYRGQKAEDDGNVNESAEKGIQMADMLRYNGNDSANHEVAHDVEEENDYLSGRKRVFDFVKHSRIPFCVGVSLILKYGICKRQGYNSTFYYTIYSYLSQGLGRTNCDKTLSFLWKNKNAPPTVLPLGERGIVSARD